MKNIDWKKILPHGIAVGVFLALAILFGYPEFMGKELRSHDDKQYKGAAKEINDYRNTHHEDPYWTGKMFSGMPAYLISFRPDNSYLEKPVAKATSLFLPRATSYIWLALISFYFMLLTFKVDPYSAIFGAIAFAFTTYFSIIMGAGHYAKNIAIAYFPFILGGINLIFQKKYIAGGIITGLATLVEIFGNHVQMTYYYFAFVVSLFLLYRAIELFRQKEFKHLIVASFLTVFFVGAGTISNMNRLLPTQEYTAYSTRGKSELTRLKDAGDQTGGLPRGYIVGYSYGPSEVMSFFIPNYKGGGNNLLFNNDIGRNAVDKKDQQILKSFDQYWGIQEGSGGAIYSGAIVVFLFLLGIVLLKYKLKWFMLVALLVTVMLSWGKNFMGFTNLFIDYFPLYNKFRAVNSILVVAEFLIPFLAVFTLYELTKDKVFWDKPLSLFGKEMKFSNKKFFLGFSGAVIGILLLMWLVPDLVQTYRQPGETEQIVEALKMQVAGEAGLNDIKQIPPAQVSQIESQAESILGVAETARKAIFKADVLRTLGFVLAGCVILYLFIIGKIKKPVAVIILTLITFIDLFALDRRYMDADNFKDKVKDKEFVASVADEQILKDQDPGYKVLNVAVSTFNDATTSYFHRSVGGYHGAKMGRYQELIEFRLSREVNAIREMLKRSKNVLPQGLTSQLYALNMLNVKYIIYNPEQPPVPNPDALGNAWFVKGYTLVETADDEIENLNNYNPADTVVVNRNFADKITSFSYVPDSTAYITLKEYEPNYLAYDYVSNVPQFTVFSEIYYDKGWKVYVDGEKADYIRTNYVLRAMVLPAGNHKVEWKFEPDIIKKASTLSLVGNIFLILGILISGTIGLIGILKSNAKE